MKLSIGGRLLLLVVLLLAVAGCSTRNSGDPTEEWLPNPSVSNPNSRLIGEMCSRLQRTEALNRVLPSGGFGPVPTYEDSLHVLCLARGRSNSEPKFDGQYAIHVNVDGYSEESVQEFRDRILDLGAGKPRLDECELPAVCWVIEAGESGGEEWGVRGFLYPYRVDVAVSMRPTRSTDESAALEWSRAKSIEVLREALKILANG